MHDPEIANAAVALLRARGLRAEYGFPGVVEVELPRGELVIAGTVNGIWETGVLDAEFQERRSLLNETLSIEAGADQIADLISREVAEQMKGRSS